ncbi:hypothetical protein N9L68_02545 [bacterium]|nr:hypothetical protein [bacterium]
MAGWHLVLSAEDVRRLLADRQEETAVAVDRRTEHPAQRRWPRLGWGTILSLLRAVRLWRCDVAKAHRTRARRGQNIIIKILRTAGAREAMWPDAWRAGASGGHGTSAKSSAATNDVVSAVLEPRALATLLILCLVRLPHQAGAATDIFSLKRAKDILGLRSSELEEQPALCVFFLKIHNGQREAFWAYLDIWNGVVVTPLEAGVTTTVRVEKGVTWGREQEVTLATRPPSASVRPCGVLAGDAGAWAGDNTGDRQTVQVVPYGGRYRAFSGTSALGAGDAGLVGCDG